MLAVKLIFVGKMREKYFSDAFAEYEKRLGAYCKLEISEIAEIRLAETPSEKEINSALAREAAEIEKQTPKGAYVVAMCVEGKKLGSTELAELIAARAGAGVSKLCFIVGGSFGLHDSLKGIADLRLSMSDMTFPHHLARVMLAEQLYRAFSINEGARYHK
ncbi:MAG: 23S rRNA (pseudouridine(1915)-N(3))-methyltransferase RlmH [Oscillospiraceae bacterium]